MARLAKTIGCFAVLWWVHATAAASYVPGQVQDGVYVRPHFVAATEQASKGPLTGVDKGAAVDGEPHVDPAVLQQPSLPRPAEDAAS